MTIITGEPTQPARITLRIDGLDDEPTCCLECLDTIESLGGESGQFDRIDCGAALERVRDPLDFLRRARRLLNAAGQLAATVANVRRESVIRGLLEGHWGASPLRLFTRREIEKLFYRAGYRVTTLEPALSASSASDRAVLPLPSGEGRGEGSILPLPSGEGRGEGAPPFFSGLSAADTADLRTERYQMEAFPEPLPDYGLTSIVIVTHNQLSYTHACLESIRFVTDEPYELIVVDNGSTDGSVEYLRSCGDVTLIENADNRGFPTAANQGIHASRGAQVLSLNNDVLVTTGWLRRMLEAMHANEPAAAVPSICNFQFPISNFQFPSSRPGLVGPLTNHASGYQEIAAGYTDLSCLDGFAWEHGKQHAGQTEDVDRLIGFCLLIRREVIDQIGHFDERFGIGNYEDDDYCRRARDAGWRLVVARDAFIHHFGHRTFEGAGVDLNALLDHNRQLFDDKWAGEKGRESKVESPKSKVASPKSKVASPKSGEDPAASVGNELRGNPPSADTASHPLPLGEGWGEGGSQDAAAPTANASSICNLQFSISNFQFPPSPGDRPSSFISPPSLIPHPSSSCTLSPAPCALSLCMIVRDNASTIRACLESIRPWVDEMIVVDTGSTDATPEICRELGAQVFHFPWPDSFAVARNESLKHARGEWIFWMDSDDVIDADNGRELRELVDSSIRNLQFKISNLQLPFSENLLGFVMQVHCPSTGKDGFIELTVVDHVKLFRNLPELRFEGRNHEQIIPAIYRLPSTRTLKGTRRLNQHDPSRPLPLAARVAGHRRPLFLRAHQRARHKQRGELRVLPAVRSLARTAARTNAAPAAEAGRAVARRLPPLGPCNWRTRLSRLRRPRAPKTLRLHSPPASRNHAQRMRILPRLYRPLTTDN